MGFLFQSTQFNWHAPALDRFAGKLPDNLAILSRKRPIIAQCQTGSRSSIAASILQASGHAVINMTGGYEAWEAQAINDSRDESLCMTTRCTNG